MDTELKLKQYFEGMIVKKSSVQGLFSALSLPAFIRDWFLKRYADDNGEVNVSFVAEKIKDILPRKESWNSILDKIISGEKVRFLTRISAKIDIKTSVISFVLPDFGVTEKETFIRQDVWEKHKDSLLYSDSDVWGVIELSYLIIGNIGKIALTDFNAFRPYTIDLEYYREARKFFEIDEWIDILLGAIDYNAEGFKTEQQKLTMLTRLIPFVEKRVNIIELAPKGTGKSYIYSQISKKGWLSSGGVMTRAKMFYDMKIKQEGLVSFYDYVALDEVSTIKFPDANEMQGALKGYLESGAYTVGNKAGSGNAGVILLGNIRSENMNTDINMFETLPEIFNDSAIIDRFHGFIEGWNIPRMSEDKKVKGWALNTEYFAEIMHCLREDVFAKAIVDGLITVPDTADTRDTTAVKRIVTGFVKLLFPNWTNSKDIDKDLLDKYCLSPAIKMRAIIKKQLGIMDVEYRNKPLPDFTIKQDNI